MHIDTSAAADVHVPGVIHSQKMSQWSWNWSYCVQPVSYLSSCSLAEACVLLGQIEWVCYFTTGKRLGKCSHSSTMVSHCLPYSEVLPDVIQVVLFQECILEREPFSFNTIKPEKHVTFCAPEAFWVFPPFRWCLIVSEWLTWHYYASSLPFHWYKRNLIDFPCITCKTSTEETKNSIKIRCGLV